MKILNADTIHELSRRFERLRPETRALWGKMNAHQMVCHLNDSFSLAMGLKKASERITFLHRTLFRWVAFHVPIPWPKGVPTRPEMDQMIGGTPPVAFEQDRDAVVSRIVRFGSTPRDFQFARHPAMGELTEWEWMRWGYLHADHHLRQFGL